MSHGLYTHCNRTTTVMATGLDYCGRNSRGLRRARRWEEKDDDGEDRRQPRVKTRGGHQLLHKILRYIRPSFRSTNLLLLFLLRHGKA